MSGVGMITTPVAKFSGYLSKFEPAGTVMTEGEPPVSVITFHSEPIAPKCVHGNGPGCGQCPAETVMHNTTWRKDG